jgi:hypothetical protein
MQGRAIGSLVAFWLTREKGNCQPHFVTAYGQRVEIFGFNWLCPKSLSNRDPFGQVKHLSGRVYFCVKKVLGSRFLSSLNYVLIPFNFFRLVSIIMLTVLAAMLVSFPNASLATRSVTKQRLFVAALSTRHNKIPLERLTV